MEQNKKPIGIKTIIRGIIIIPIFAIISIPLWIFSREGYLENWKTCLYEIDERTDYDYGGI